jgi:hypothetical protein
LDRRKVGVVVGGLEVDDMIIGEKEVCKAFIKLCGDVFEESLRLFIVETWESTANIDDFKGGGMDGFGHVKDLTTHLKCLIILRCVFTATADVETDPDDFKFEIGCACEQRLCVFNVYPELG